VNPVFSAIQTVPLVTPFKHSTPKGVLKEMEHTFQKVGHFLELGDLVWTEDALLLEHGEDDLVLLAEVLGHELEYGVEDRPPGAYFRLGIRDRGDRVTAAN
jgi:hypothetical protein